MKTITKQILHFLELVEDYPAMISVRASDNYISEKIEKILLEVLEKNKALIEFNVSGNRLSLCCLNRIQKVLSRNQKALEEREPNKIRTEIYRLKYEQKKIMMARDKLQQQVLAFCDYSRKKKFCRLKSKRIDLLVTWRRFAYKSRRNVRDFRSVSMSTSC